MKRLFAFLLALVMVVGVSPAPALHAHATEVEGVSIATSTGYPVINEGEIVDVECECGESYFFEFTPEYTHTYTYYSSNSIYRTYGEIDKASFDENSDYEINFSHTGTLYADTTYVLETWSNAPYPYSIGIKANHAGEVTVITPATCETDGLQECDCTECGQKVKEVIPMYGHSYVDGACENCGTPVQVLFSGTCGENATWVLDTAGVLTISGSGNMENWSEYDAPWTEYSESIISVVIGDGVTSIGDNAFYCCANLEMVSMCDSVAMIGNSAFSNCSSLRKIEIPESVAQLGSYAFLGCSNLSEIKLLANIALIGEGMFNGCSNLETIVIPETVTEIESYAFSGCTNLTEIVLPSQLSVIGAMAFGSCTSLAYVSIPENVKEIGADCFAGCYNLEAVIFQGNAPSIDEYGFSYVYTTAYYPAGNSTWTEEVMQDYGGTITWIPYEQENEYAVTYTNASLSLAGDIGVNYYAQLSDALIASEGAYMQFDVAGRTQTIPVSEAVVDADGVYRFSCKVAAKQMTDTIVGQMYLADGTAVGEAKAYSVKAYCDAAIPAYGQYEAYADLVALMEAMLNYGAYSQLQLDYNTDILANTDLADTSLPAITEANVAAYAHGAEGSEEGISVSSVSLLLESNTTIRFYFQMDGTRPIDQYTFFVDGVKVTPVESNGQYYVDKVNVAAKDLDRMATVTVGGLTVNYCGLSYVRQVAVLYPDYYDESLVNVAKALYAYNQAANAYF